METVLQSAMATAAAEIKLCTWADLSLTDVNELMKYSSDRDVLKRVLSKKLGIQIEKELSTFKLKQNVIEADLFAYTFLFGLREKYCPAQLSTVITMVKRLHTLCVSSLFDNHSEAIRYFQKLVLQHSVNRPPFSIQIFNPSEVKHLNEYILSTYFKHYKLYKYAFTRKVQLNMSLTYAGEVVETETDNKEDADALAQESAAEQEEQSVGEPVHDTVTETTSSKIKELISADLSKMVQQEQERLQSQLAAQESRLIGRINTLEASIDLKRPTTNSGKKKNKTSH